MKPAPWALASLLWIAEAFAGESAVYPPAREALEFSHARHAQLACAACHGDRSLAAARPENRPGHDRCASCHGQWLEGPSTRCRACHRGEQRGANHESAFLRFSHPLHATGADSCRRCHDLAARSASGRLPEASRCQACHGDWMESPSRCDRCHPAGPGGRLQTRTPFGRLRPRGGHGGDDHGPGFDRTHGPAALGGRERCLRCHEEQACARCHRGTYRPLAIHPPDWRLSHPGPARSGSQDCDACHRSRAECLGCHQAAGVAEGSPRRPRNQRLHPAGYGDGRHAAEARAHLPGCVSCHAESDCIRCHGAAGIGGGMSPHPPGFSARCALMRQRNERACAKCHMAGDLERRCP